MEPPSADYKAIALSSALALSASYLCLRGGDIGMSLLLPWLSVPAATLTNQGYRRFTGKKISWEVIVPLIVIVSLASLLRPLLKIATYRLPPGTDPKWAELVREGDIFSLENHAIFAIMSVFGMLLVTGLVMA